MANSLMSTVNRKIPLTMVGWPVLVKDNRLNVVGWPLSYVHSYVRNDKQCVRLVYLCNDRATMLGAS